MLRTNFFFKFFKYKKSNSHNIELFHSSENFSVKDQISKSIKEIDKQISENSQALIEAQIVKLRSSFSRSNNLIEQIGKNVYKTKLEDSIYWHQKQLEELYIKRNQLKKTLEKLKGVFWLNQIKRLLKIILIGLFVFLSLFIFLSGFMIIIYLMPLIILILLVYLVASKRN
tara:strand:- start:105 stop:617 length:513 start_codon:yes stop_codon:yes gene_type:complete